MTALRALLSNVVDYAGLFPPATLHLDAALDNYAAYIRSAEAWMLGAFILPVAQFDAAAAHFGKFDVEHPLRISALGSKAADGKAFADSLGGAAEAIRTFNDRLLEAVRVEQFEMPLPNDINSDVIASLRSAFHGQRVRTFWESTPDRAEEILRAFGEHNRTQGGQPLGFKLRTGGVTADAFPTAEQIACVLIAAATHGVPIKFTAGLHHPVRMFRDEVKTKMHGFLNVLGAAIFVLEDRWSVSQTVRMLEDENPASFSFANDVFVWHDQQIRAERIAAHRRVVTSFGSCSFDEPRDDLRAMGVL